MSLSSSPRSTCASSSAVNTGTMMSLYLSQRRGIETLEAQKRLKFCDKRSTCKHQPAKADSNSRFAVRPLSALRPLQCAANLNQICSVASKCAAAEAGSEGLVTVLFSGDKRESLDTSQQGQTTTTPQVGGQPPKLQCPERFEYTIRWAGVFCALLRVGEGQRHGLALATGREVLKVLRVLGERRSKLRQEREQTPIAY